MIEKSVSEQFQNTVFNKTWFLKKYFFDISDSFVFNSQQCNWKKSDAELGV